MTTYQRRSLMLLKDVPGGAAGLDADGHVPVGDLPLTSQQAYLLRRTGALAETFTRGGALTQAQPALVSGQETQAAIPLLKGTVVSKITFMSGSTAAVTPTNQWFTLRSSALALLGVTNDDTTTAWGANAEKQLTLATPYTVTADGLFYLGIMVAAGTVPNLTGVAASGASAIVTPLLASRDTTHTGLTNPASAPSTATVGFILYHAYAWVS